MGERTANAMTECSVHIRAVDSPDLATALLENTRLSQKVVQLTKQVAQLTAGAQKVQTDTRVEAAKLIEREQQLEHLQIQHQRETTRHNLAAAQLQEQYNSAQSQLNAAEQRLTAVQAAFDESARKRRRESPMPQPAPSSLLPPPSGIDIGLVQQLRADLSRSDARARQAENSLAVLQAQRENVSMLEERAHSMQGKLARLQGENDSLRQAHACAEPQAASVVQWSTILGQLGSPSEIYAHYREMEAQLVLKEKALSDLTVSRTGLNRKAHKLHAQHKEVLKEAAAAKLCAANLKQQEAAATRKLVELEAQVESLQAVAEFDLKASNVKLAAAGCAWDKRWADAAGRASGKQLKAAENQLTQAHAETQQLNQQVQQLQTDLSAALAPPAV